MSAIFYRGVSPCGFTSDQLTRESYPLLLFSWVSFFDLSFKSPSWWRSKTTFDDFRIDITTWSIAYFHMKNRSRLLMEKKTLVLTPKSQAIAKSLLTAFGAGTGPWKVSTDPINRNLALLSILKAWLTKAGYSSNYLTFHGLCAGAI